MTAMASAGVALVVALDYDNGVRAAVCALCGGTLFSVSMIPSEERLLRLPDVPSQVINSDRSINQEGIVFSVANIHNALVIYANVATSIASAGFGWLTAFYWIYSTEDVQSNQAILILSIVMGIISLIAVAILIYQRYVRIEE